MGSGRRVLLEVVAVLVAFAAIGAAGGWLWSRLWPEPTGVAQQGQWIPDPVADGLQAQFAATAYYVVVGVVAALVLGVLAALLARTSELATLGAVALGSALAAYVSYRVGTGLAPPDPGPIAAAAADGTSIAGNLFIEGFTPFLAWTFGAVLGLGVVYLFTLGAGEVRRRDDSDPTWMSPPGPAAQPKGRRAL